MGLGTLGPAAVAPSVATAQTAYTLRELAADPVGSAAQAQAIAADGTVVGSVQTAGGPVAVVWTPQGDVRALAPPDAAGAARAIAGPWVVGRVDRACGQAGAFVWTEATGAQPLGPESCERAVAVSVNNAGQALLLVGFPAVAQVWAVDGSAAPRQLASWDGPVAAAAIDAQGRVLGGVGGHPVGGPIMRAIEWLPDGSHRLLERLDPMAAAPDLAADRNEAGLVVGQAGAGARSRAAIWDGAGTPTDAGGALGPGTSSFLLAVNDAGVAVGGSDAGAIRWDADAGTRTLASLAGPSAAGWTLLTATDINNDGRICGEGLAPDGRTAAWVLIPDAADPPDCPADLDADGSLTIFDFLAFQNAFDAMDPAADFDADGEFTLFDFLAFQNAFDAGC